MGATVSMIIDRKGSSVATIAPDETLATAAERLAERRIGALVVSRDGRSVEGILSERDLVGQLAAAGAGTPELTVAEAMNTDVVTCGPATTTDELARMMTEGRFRHVPVLDDGLLIGIVSIGDVVKARIDELTLETGQLQAYVTGGY